MADERHHSELIPARGPLRHDLEGMPSADFERLCYRLVRLEHSEIEKPAESADGGADALLPKNGGGYARAWQIKHYPNKIHWEECKKSYAVARENFEPERYTFCFPRNLTKTEQKTFDKHFRGENAAIPVDYWSGDEIRARLAETPEGKVVAKQFFKDDGETLEAIKRAAEAKGPLDTPEDALKRMRPIGEYLTASDPYFAYAGSTYGDGAETKPPEGTIMSVSESDERTTSRIDVVPNDPEAMELHAPRGRMQLPVEVYREAEKALARGEDFTAEGVEVTWEQLPPAFGEEIGLPQRADVTIGPAHRRPPAPWDARLSVENQGESARIDIDLRPVDPPEGWDGALRGSRAGLTVGVVTRRVGERGEARFTYSYSLSRDPAREQLKALRFMDLAARPGGTLRIAERRASEREVTLQTGAEEDSEPLETLRTFLGWIVEIEDWADVPIGVGPGDFSQENFDSVAQIAAALRRGGFNVEIGEIGLVLVPDAPPEIPKEAPLVLRRDLAADVLGQTVRLGRGQIVLEDYEFVERGNDEQGRRLVGLRTGNAEAAKTIERLSKPQKSKKPPPPPRKKHRSRRGRNRRKRGR